MTPQIKRFAELWVDLQMAHDAHDDLGQMIGYGAGRADYVDALLARDTTAD